MVSEITCAGRRWTLNMNTIDSLAFMFSPIYLRLEGSVTPPPQDWEAGATTDGKWPCKIAWMEEMIFSIAFMFNPIYLRLEDVPCRVEFFLNMNTIDSLAFMFSPIYLRLESNVIPPPFPRIKKLEPLQVESDLSRLPEWRRWYFSIAFMFNPIYLRLEDVPPPPLRIEIFFKHKYYRFLSIHV